MRYQDLLKKRSEMSGAKNPPHSGSRSRKIDPKGENGTSGTERDTDPLKREGFVVGEAVIGVEGKKGEIEKLYAKMEKFSGYGHGILTIDEDDDTEGGGSILIKEKNIGKMIREDCIAPSDARMKCWDFNQQVGIKSFDECFECQIYQGSGVEIPGEESGRDSEGKTVTGDTANAEFMYESFVTAIKGIYQGARNSRRINIGIAKSIAGRLIEKVPEDNKLLWQAINARRGSQLASHVLNVAIFAVKVGSGLKYTGDELNLLVTASVLHDLGMTCIPNEIIEKKGKLTRREYDLIKQHPLHSMEILRNSASERPDRETERLIRIVGEEHERENGTGYPEGKTSEQIDELAKVIGVLDVFEALSHDREHRSEYSSFQAIQVIIQMRNEFFSTKVVKAVITEISIFPLESYVMLNNGEIGRVVKTNYSHPMRPLVEVIRDSKGNKLKKTREVDLAENPLIFITRPVEENEV